MARTISFLLAALFAAAAVGGQSAQARDIEDVFVHDGYSRRYILHIPDGVAEGERRPLLVALHGGDGRAERFRDVSGFDAVAEREGFFVLYPQGYERHWNDGRALTEFEAHAQNIHDVDFLAKLIDYVDGVHVPVDRNRVYATGISNGGMMALRLACERADLLAGIAVVAANMPSRMEPRCRPQAPVSVLVINGTRDPLVPYIGGYIRIGLRRLGRVISTDDTIRFWVERNGCAGQPRIRTLENREPDNHTETEVVSYTDCRDSRVVLYRIDRGGHTWPGGPQYLPERVVGKVSGDFRAEEAIWNFFSGRSD